MVSKLFKNGLLKQNALRASVTGKTFIPVHKCILNWAPIIIRLLLNTLNSKENTQPKRVTK